MTFESDLDWADRYTGGMIKTLSRLLKGTVVVDDKVTHDFLCIDGPNKDEPIEVKFRRQYYGDIMVEIKNTYSNPTESYPGWYYTQLEAGYLAYVIPSRNKVFFVKCSELKKLALDGEHKFCNSTKYGRPHRTENVSISLKALKTCPSFIETHIGD